MRSRDGLFVVVYVRYPPTVGTLHADRGQAGSRVNATG